MDYFLKQPEDGYNLLWITPSQILKMAKDSHLYSFTKEDFSYIGICATSPFVLGVNKENLYKTLEDFLDHAKRSPGELSFSSSGIGLVVHFAGEVFMMKTGVKLTHVPFTGGAPAVVALLGGHVTCYPGSMGALGAHVKPGGKLRVLAVLGPKRIPEFHEIPTCLEKGYNVGDHGTYMVLITKKGTLKPVLDTLAKVFKKRADDPDVKTALIKRGICSLESGPRGNGEKSQSGIRDGP